MAIEVELIAAAAFAGGFMAGALAAWHWIRVGIRIGWRAAGGEGRPPGEPVREPKIDQEVAD